MKPLERISLQCIYCDDIRDEIGGKTTIVGWYGGEHVQLPPDGTLLLPSLCVIGLVAMPLTTNYAVFKLELLLGDAILHSINIPPESVGDTQASVDGLSWGKEIRIAIKMNNIPVPGPGVLRLRIAVDGDEYLGNGLRFTR